MGVLSSFAFAPAERTDIHKQITLLMLQPQLWDDRSQESSGCRLAPVHYVESVKNFLFAFLASSLVSPWRASSLCFLSLYFNRSHLHNILSFCAYLYCAAHAFQCDPFGGFQAAGQWKSIRHGAFRSKDTPGHFSNGRNHRGSQPNGNVSLQKDSVKGNSYVM